MNIKQTGKSILGTITIIFVSGLAALLCTGALILTFGLFFWFLDDFVFDLLNLPPKFEYDSLSLLRSVSLWLVDAHLIIFFVLWAIIFFFAYLKRDWIKAKLTLTKENKNL